MVVHAPKPSTLREKINYELLNVLEWTKANKITLNPPKSSVLIIPPKTTNPILNINVFIDNDLVFINETVKYLGVTIDARFKFDKHIDILTKKIFRSVGILSELRRILPTTALRHLYYSMIHSQILYYNLGKYLRMTSIEKD